jgi:hypothetical protein
MPVQLADLDLKKERFPILLNIQPLDLFFKGKITFQCLKEGEEIEFAYSWLLGKILLSSMSEAETQTPNIEVNYGHIYHFATLMSLVKKEHSPKEMEHEALLNLAMEFSKVEKVKSIYFQRYREEIQVYVLLSISRYDSDLMDILLDREYDIRKRFPELVFEFFYPPADISDKKDFIHPQAQCIYAS